MESITKEWTPTEVHDWEGKERSVLVLNYTMACALACDFCCYGCNPRRKEKMPIALARRLIIEASELNQFSSVAFTGGEPLLFPEEIIDLASTAKERSVPFTIATACHWAENYNYTYTLLKELKDLGLIRLNVSHDPSHEVFVHRDCILNVAKASEELGLATYIVGTFSNPNINMNSYLPEVVAFSHVELITKFVAKVGMAKKWDISQEKYNLDLSVEDLCCYRRIHHDIVVWHDGKVYPCCSTFNRSTRGLEIGNANNISLDKIWDLVEGSLLYRIMKRKGFGELYNLIRERKPELYALLPNPDLSVGPCSLCNSIFRDRYISQEIFKVFSEYESEKVALAVEKVVQLIGENKTTELMKRCLK
ncbi:TPA: radical SAM/SPASM domain-containing protein [Vibrio parahaemolyticus]|uniref:radical SAM protein n=1 Tax=Vibrio parahaemolyticus TaxID=670 RepID=UPI001B834EE2|nr:radical SAM/SPASM domain-containing protein [Vibrio parahaemolyticus]MCC3780979.1 radical SAM protein [Vibrio parahaemolyticus]HBC3919989.1 radical SAM protein [Vibrio parahaemolyticus]